MPATAHWRAPNGEAVLWMVDPHEVHAVASDHHLVIEVPGAASELRFLLYTTDRPVANGTAVTASGMRVGFAGEIASVSLANIGIDAYEIRAVPSNAGASGISTVVRFIEAQHDR
jgi:hypothetical protein